MFHYQSFAFMFKLPSFVKLPKYKRFDFQPRYYNAAEEERKNRIKQAEQKAAAERGENYEHGSLIRGAFERNRGSRLVHQRKTDFSQAIFVVGFAAFFVGYYYYGNLAFYASIPLFAFYVWLKTKKK